MSNIHNISGSGNGESDSKKEGKRPIKEKQSRQ